MWLIDYQRTSSPYPEEVRWDSRQSRGPSTLQMTILASGSQDRQRVLPVNLAPVPRETDQTIVCAPVRGSWQCTSTMPRRDRAEARLLDTQSHNNTARADNVTRKWGLLQTQLKTKSGKLKTKPNYKTTNKLIKTIWVKTHTLQSQEVIPLVCYM